VIAFDLSLRLWMERPDRRKKYYPDQYAQRSLWVEIFLGSQRPCVAKDAAFTFVGAKYNEIKEMLISQQKW
jgi:hypothetical protein